MLRKVNDLKDILHTGKLPGREAHAKLLPGNRPVDHAEETLRRARPSAVMILLHEKQDELLCTLIERPDYQGVHSRQMAFPGGKAELGDESLLHTALREMEEEIGVEADRVEVVGSLTELYIPPSNFLVHPFVGVLQDPPVYRPDPLEVSEVVEFSIYDLHRRHAVRQVEVPTRLYGRMRVPAFILADKVVWGATAAILSEMREVLKW